MRLTINENASKKLNYMIAWVLSEKLFVVGIYAFRISICDAFLSQFNDNAREEKVSLKKLKQLKNSLSAKCYH